MSGSALASADSVDYSCPRDLVPEAVVTIDRSLFAPDLPLIACRTALCLVFGITLYGCMDRWSGADRDQPGEPVAR
jgi:hypothetical protein